MHPTTVFLLSLVSLAYTAPQTIPVSRDDPLGFKSILSAAPSAETPTSAAGPHLLTRITPSPGAEPVDVTSMSQPVTSFVPVMTLCQRANASSASSPPPPPPSLATDDNAAVVAVSNCSVAYSPTVSPVCATTLSGIASRLVISRCDQIVTFSTHSDYALIMPAAASSSSSSPPAPPLAGNMSIRYARAAAPVSSSSLQQAAPLVQTLTTFYEAPWQAVTQGLTPENVTQRVCSVGIADQTSTCVDYLERWQTVSVTSTRLVATNVDLTTTVQGPGEVFVETAHLSVTGSVEEVRLSSQMVVVVTTEGVSTSRSLWKVGVAGAPSATGSARPIETEAVKGGRSKEPSARPQSPTSGGLTTSTTSITRTHRSTVTITRTTTRSTTLATAATASPALQALGQGSERPPA